MYSIIRLWLVLLLKYQVVYSCNELFLDPQIGASHTVHLETPPLTSKLFQRTVRDFISTFFHPFYEELPHNFTHVQYTRDKGKDGSISLVFDSSNDLFKLVFGNNLQLTSITRNKNQLTIYTQLKLAASNDDDKQYLENEAIDTNEKYKIFFQQIFDSISSTPISEPESLISTPLEAMEKFRRTHPHSNIVFTDRALNTANSNLKPHHHLSGDVYEMLESLITLHNLLFGPTKSNNPIRDFESQAHYSLKLSESHVTKSNASVFNERSDEYQGLKFQAWPHIVKTGDLTKVLHIYFHIDNDHKRIIISWIGHHLKTVTIKRH